MKSLKIILALVLVLGMTGTSFATFTIGLTETFDANLAAGLRSFTIHTTGAVAFQDLALSGVHQLNMDFGTITPSIYPADLFGNPISLANDTHLLFPSTDILIGAGAFTETNINNNPASINMALIAPLNEAGIGTFGGGTAFAFKAEAATAALAGLDLMQIVIQTGSTVFLTGIAIDNATETPIALNLQIPVPEPSTILMLLAGSLCLLAVRSRK